MGFLRVVGKAIQRLYLVVAEGCEDALRGATGEPFLTGLQLLLPKDAHGFIAPALYAVSVCS